GELNDPTDQRTRFEEQMQRREAGDKEAQFIAVAAGADNLRVLDNVFYFLDTAFNKALLLTRLGVIGVLA
ncbi:MAG: hypothetical protein M1400_00185, partial [Patescibacteria group bacterium]|nr:hypothetical protein [Patescibacteria group bacterium]